jgi:hypothetical protein
MNKEVMAKFESSVEKTPTCWNWTGFTDKKGLPLIRVGGRKNFKEYSARRISLELAGFVFPPGRKQVQPLVCKNKLCVNPTHLVCGDAARFWAKVQKLSQANGSCWIWTASLDKDMYGKFRLSKGGKKIDIRAHQYSWELATGLPVANGILVCHTCDHPYCVNPDHLFLGSHADNHADRNQKGRQAKGEKQHLAKLTEEKVKQIRELRKLGSTIPQLSRLFVVSTSNIGSIERGEASQLLIVDGLQG